MQKEQQSQGTIYFQQVLLRQKPAISEKLETDIENQLNQEQAQQSKKVEQQFQNSEQYLQLISHSAPTKQQDLQQLYKAINEYSVNLVKYQKQQIFFQHAVQGKFIGLLLKKLQQFKFTSDIVRTVFSTLQFLLKAIRRDDQYVYLMVSINKQGFVTAKYHFDEDDSAYFANFLKLLTRKINEDEKYLNIFFNLKEPQFPLLLNLLRFHDSRDQILRTSVKLTLIEICSNQSKSIQTFVSNFPFVMFYPIHVYQIYNSFMDSISGQQPKCQEGVQNLKNSLKFMEDFIQNKDRQAIQMYTNCFMTLIGKYIYKQLAQLSAKSQQKIIRMLKIILEVVIKDVSVLKIKLGLGQYFTKYIGKGLRKFLKSKTHHLEFNYWLIAECKDDIHEHCLNLFTHPKSEGKKLAKKSSLIKTFNSYIPRSKDNWLFYELKKISEMIGFQILFNKAINSQEYMNGSYLKAIESDSYDQDSSNQAFQKFIKYDCEQILFYYLKLAKELKVPLKTAQIQENQTVLDHLHTINRVTSLSVVKSFYELVLQSEIYIDQIKCIQVKHLFEGIHEKLIYYILSEGWNSFIHRSKIDLRKQNNDQFSPDIFRDLQCQILFFVAVRHLLGTKNYDCFIDDQEFMSKDIRRTETKAACLLMQQCSDGSQIQQPIDIVLDGQYIKLMDQDSKMISSENILINRCHIYESEQTNSIQIVQKQNSETPGQQFFCLQFVEAPIKNYIWKQIKWRKQIIMEIELKLKLMKFQLVQDQRQ